MALSNLNKETINNLFTMITINEKTNVNHNLINNIKKDSITFAQLSILYNQMENLKLEANKIIQSHYETNEINNIHCNFKKVPGTIYHLYKKNSKYILSLVEPEEKNNIIFDEYYSSYLYDYDLSFKKIT